MSFRSSTTSFNLLSALSLAGKFFNFLHFQCIKIKLSNSKVGYPASIYIEICCGILTFYHGLPSYSVLQQGCSTSSILLVTCELLERHPRFCIFSSTAQKLWSTPPLCFCRVMAKKKNMITNVAAEWECQFVTMFLREWECTLGTQGKQFPHIHYTQSVHGQRMDNEQDF